MNLGPGSVRITADTALITSAAPIRVFGVCLVSGATASTLTLRNGTSASATAYEQVDGVASQSVTKNYAGGLYFPSGCFADVDANISYATIICQKEVA